MATTRDKLIIGVDFGTTTSVVAFGYAAQQDIITVVDEYPNTTSRLTYEVYPTEIWYDADGKVRIGHQIEADQPRFQFFKLDLNENKEHEVSYVARCYPAAMAKQPDLNKPAATMTTDYLRELHEHAMSYISARLGEGVLSSTPVSYVLTVPAMWSEKAKELTRRCARDAGFDQDIYLISEPEAAVTHALDALRNSGLRVGDIFVCCDAGGGTGDLISYEIISLGKSQSIKVKEAASGMGDLCGGSFVNNKFQKWFIEKFSKEDGYDEETLEDAVQSFENLKRDFTGEGDRFPIKVYGLRNIPEKNVKKNKLTLTLAEMEYFHSDVVSSLTTLVKSQIKATNSKVRAVLLVGGFGQSEHPKRQLKYITGPDVEIIQPRKGQVAIARGALLQGFALSNDRASRVHVESRVCCKSFGLEVGVIFNAGKHRVGDKYWDAFRGRYHILVMDWFIKKDQSLEQTKYVEHKFCRTQLVSEGKFDVVRDEIVVYDGENAENPPAYKADGCRMHTVLEADLSRVPVSEIRKSMGSDGKRHYRIHYSIRAQFFSAHTEWTLWHNGNNYGAVKAEYE